MEWWKGYRYKHLSGMAVSLGIAYLVSGMTWFEHGVILLGAWGGIGAFIGGMLFVSSLTVGFGTFVLIKLKSLLTPFEISLIAGYGGMIADILLLRIMKDHLLSELRPLYHRLHGPDIHRKIKSSYLRWTLPILGTFIIVSPMPDEIGIGLLGLTNIRQYQLVLITFLLNTIGIYVIVRVL